MQRFKDELAQAWTIAVKDVRASGLINPWLDLAVLSFGAVLLLWPSLGLHHRAGVLGC